MNLSRLNPREKILLAAIAGVVFVLLNLILIKGFTGRLARLRADLASKKSEIGSLETMRSERDLWAARAAWIAASQPKLANENAAGVAMLDDIRQAAAKHGVAMVDNPNFATPGKTAHHRSIAVNIDIKSSWKGLIEFLHGMQKPDKFIVLESATMQIDAEEPSKLRCKLKIARWYAP